jgi:invasion protein IalB
MTKILFKISRPLSLATIVLGVSLTPVLAGTNSPDTATAQIQKPIILAQAKHDPEKEEKAKKVKPAKKKVAAKKEKNPWSVQCGEDSKTGKKFCRMQQSLRFKKTGQRILAVVIQPQTIEPKLAILLSLPHGLYLPAGTAFKIDDGEENRMLIETCDAEGCYATGGISDKQVEAMKKGKKILVGFQASSKKPITVPITLSGFTAAFKKITESK